MLFFSCEVGSFQTKASVNIVRRCEIKELTILIPAGIPEPAKDRTSRLVKSGLKNSSFSKSLVQGNLGIIDSATLTRPPNACVRSTFTQAANP